MSCHCNIFCQLCGDCLECYHEDPCYDGGPHMAPPPDDLAKLVEANDKCDAARESPSPTKE